MPCVALNLVLGISTADSASSLGAKAQHNSESLCELPCGVPVTGRLGREGKPVSRQAPMFVVSFFPTLTIPLTLFLAVRMRLRPALDR